MTLLMMLFSPGVRGDNTVGFARIDRSSTEQSGELDGDDQQQIARLTGYGEFLVRTARIGAGDSLLAQGRMFFLFGSSDAIRGNQPLKRILCFGRKCEARAETENDSEWVCHCLKVLAAESSDEKIMVNLMPEILRAAIYANRAELCRADFRMLSDEKLEKLHANSLISGFEWIGRFVLGNGSVEDVTVTQCPGRERLIEVKRVEVRPPNHSKNIEEEVSGTEQWVISNVSTWKPSKSQSFIFTLATMGNIKAKYQLGLALVEETDEQAKAEGLKWLRLAAADGYEDAVKSLALLEFDSRSPRGREAVNKTTCCRIQSRR